MIGGCWKGLLQGNSRYGWAWYSFYQNLLQERGVGRVGAATREGGWGRLVVGGNGWGCYKALQGKGWVAG